MSDCICDDTGYIIFIQHVTQIQTVRIPKLCPDCLGDKRFVIKSITDHAESVKIPELNSYQIIEKRKILSKKKLDCV